jgi:phosphotriesterase-related protein
MSHARVSLVNRRQALGLLAAGSAAGLMGRLHEAPMFAQTSAPGWLTARGRATFPRGAVIRTLLKDLAPGDLAAGATLFHEHVGGTFTPAPPPGPSDILPGPLTPKSEAEYLDLMVEELKMARADGVGCLVDAALGHRTEPVLANLRQIATRSGMHLVAAGGYYQDLSMPSRLPPDVAAMDEDQLAEQLVRDAAAQRWGAFGEIASSPQMQPEERTLLRAIGKAQVRTGLPIFTHTPHEGCPSCALEQLDTFESVGVDPRRVCIGHLATIKAETEPLAQTARALARRGAFLGFDTVGHQMGRSAIPEVHKVRYALAVLEAGYEEHLLLSGDSTPVPQMKANWGNGYSTVVVQFVPKLRYAGVKDATLRTILVDNPRRFLAFVPRSAS